MADSYTSVQRAKLAPILVETSFNKSSRNVPARHGPNPELTPDPSPQSTSPVEMEFPSSEKRRFAPQLVETSRRARRAGDAGPRPADKTDVTPYAKSKYKAKGKGKAKAKGTKRQADDDSRDKGDMSGAGSEDGFLLDRAAQKAERQMREAALAAFPNSRARAGGAAHFYFRESESDTSPESRSPSQSRLHTEPLHRLRRRSSTDLEWWHKLHREHSEKLSRAHERILMPKPVRPLFAQFEQDCHADPELNIMRRAASPPLLGGDIVFRRCESPETAKIHTDLHWTAAEEEEKCRDQTQKGGLWKGFCFKAGGGDETTVKCGLWGPKMISTPNPPSTPHQGSFHVSCSTTAASLLSPPPTPAANALWGGGAPNPRTEGTSGHSYFPSSVCKPHSEDQVARETSGQGDREMDMEKRINTEFDDAFVTKVYNYLSLGYPVSARAFDSELCKITGMCEDEIKRDDEKNFATGHVCDDVVAKTPEERQCPRWRALKAYIREWAKQHPDLDGQNLSPKGWGVKNRGGWGS